ncbi:MAG: thaumatin family protein [Streptosporangiaceae bacterium]
MSFDSITEAAARRLARPHNRRRFLGWLGGTAAAVGLGSFALSEQQAHAQTTLTVTFVNNSGQTIWPGALGNSGQPILNDGGWELTAGDTMSISVPNTWSGRFWARTYCTFDSSGAGSCETGDCGGVLECDGAGGAPNVSLAEFTFGGGTSNDVYDVSFVDAFNIPITITPAGGSTSSSDAYQCTTAGCTANLNPDCPSALQDVDSSGNIIACLSACQEFGADEYCCAGAYDTPSTCIPADWPVDYAEYFKSACPGAYSYAYDDPTSTFTCLGASGYTITFGDFGATSSGSGGGGGGTTNATSTIVASDYTAENDTQTQATSDTGGGLNVCYIQNGSWLQYDNIDFGSTGLTQFYGRVASGAAAGISGLVQVVLDDLSNDPVSSFSIGNTGGWQDWETVPANMSTVTGTHTVYIVFVSGQSADFVNFNWFTFS